MTDIIKNKLLYIILDIIVIDFAILASIGLWFDGSIPGGISVNIPHEIWIWYGYMAVIAAFTRIAVFMLFGFYSKLWRYTASDEMIKVVIAETLVFVLIFFIDKLFLSNLGLMILPKRLLLAAWSISLILFVISRFGYRLIKRFFIGAEHLMTSKAGMTRVMIVGGGYGGFNVVRSILRNDREYMGRVPVIIVDDDKLKNNTNINGVRIVNSIEDIPRLAEEYEIEEIIIAIPSATNVELKRIMSYCNKTNCLLKTIPPISDVSNDIKHHLRDVNISDLLFRDEVKIDIESVSGYIKNKVVLVTGGGGSIGSELCRQIVKFSPETLIVFDIYENNAYILVNELKRKYANINYRICIGSVRDYGRLEKIFEMYKPSVIYHAAAHKHVSLMQFCPAEAVKNNVFGTYNVAKCADKFGADRFVLLSTDKAVNPTNVMGATKRITELIIQLMSQKSKTKFMAVRFGNVLGSSGSVIPLFQKQIEEGGPVTVTHPDVVRYFMTIPEASRLVLQAAGLGQSGKIFVLDMGDPVKIDELARNLIRLSGYIPDKDIKIKYTGLRPGEKLFEELIMDEEQSQMKVTYHKKIFVTKPTDIDWEKFENDLERLRALAENNEDVCPMLSEILPNFHNTDNSINTGGGHNLPDNKKNN